MISSLAEDWWPKYDELGNSVFSMNKACQIIDQVQYRDFVVLSYLSPKRDTMYPLTLNIYASVPEREAFKKHIVAKREQLDIDHFETKYSERVLLEGEAPISATDISVRLLRIPYVKIQGAQLVPAMVLTSRELLIAHVFTCCLSVDVHEAQENFYVNGERVLDPHKIGELRYVQEK